MLCDDIKNVDDFINAYGQHRIVLESWPRIKKFCEDALTKAPNNARGEICPLCNGIGVTSGNNLASFSSVMATCVRCHGTGKLPPVA
jgi:DnaJ-class molecular chaperone